MSRSYKHHPIVKQEREDYHYLNRKLRHDKLAKIPKGNFFRRFIPKPHEWKYIWTKEQAIQEWHERSWIRERYTYDEWMNYWKSFLRK